MKNVILTTYGFSAKILQSNTKGKGGRTNMNSEVFIHATKCLMPPAVL